MSRKEKNFQGGFTMIELIAAMVLVAIMAPTMGLLVQNALRSMMNNNIVIQATEDAGYVIRNFTKHIDGVKRFTDGSLTDSTVSFTSYADDDVYVYQLRDGNRDLIYSRDDGEDTVTGALIKNVVVDSTVDIYSKFIYRGHDNSDLIGTSKTPTDANIKSIELTFVLLRNKEIYKYNIYVLPDKEAHINPTGIEL
jgi:prepilin-type N-terminal cleavage/methylation domain-containing protein